MESESFSRPAERLLWERCMEKGRDTEGLLVLLVLLLVVVLPKVCWLAARL
jgi:hypothetical protein